MIVIPFLINHARGEKKTKRQENILKELKPEYPGIIMLFANYYMRLKNELGGVIPISKESASYKKDFVAEVETDLDRFIDINITFETGKIVKKSEVYDKYKDYFEFDENSVKRGEALSAIRFSKFILKNYKNHVDESVQRIQGGKPARVFVGMRIKTDEEIATEAEARQKIKNTSPQVIPKPAPAQAPEEAPVDDIEPF
jgi:hypothetical protein